MLLKSHRFTKSDIFLGVPDTVLKVKGPLLRVWWKPWLHINVKFQNSHELAHSFFQYNKLEYMERKNQVEEALRKNTKRFVNYFCPC